MGEDKLFLKEVRRIMNTTEGKEFREAVRKAQSQTNLPIDYKKFENVHVELRRALQNAKRNALDKVDVKMGRVISDRRFVQKNTEYQTRKGNIDAIIQMENK